MTIDVVLISDAKNNVLRNLTNNAIRSAGKDSNIIVVESNRKVSYENARVIYPSVPFNYNGYLNIGAKEGTSEYIFFGNNDLLFNQGWDTEIIWALNNYQSDSASPICPYTHSIFDINIHSGVYEGVELIKRFCGWAFVWRRSFYEEVGQLDETFTFWCSDNCTIEQLLKHKKKHILVTSSIVNHLSLGRNTLRFTDKVTKTRYTKLETEKFEKMFKKKWDVDWPELYSI